MTAHTHWLNRERLSVYPRVVLVLFLAIGIHVMRVFLSNDMVDPSGQPLGYDFIAFWAASHLALTGHAQDAYSIPLLSEAIQIAVSTPKTRYQWFYPPSFYLVILPLALLPYIVSYVTFMLSTLGACVVVLRRAIRGSTAMWCLAAFSGLWINFFSGQNGFLTAALAGAALLSLERKPAAAGLFTGLLLAIKPHLAILFPLAFIAVGAWRTLITAVLTATTFTALGTAILGPAVLKEFLASLGHVQLFLENGFLPLTKMPTVFAFMRLLGTPYAGAYIVHWAVAAGAVATLWLVWHRSHDLRVRGAALMTATFLVSPYVFYYDLVWLAFPIAWLALAGESDGWLHGEREVLVFAWLLPVLIAPIAKTLSFQIGPLVLGSLLWIIYRRATATPMICATKTDRHSNRLGTL